MRDIAGLLGITERATRRIVGDLDRAGYVERRRTDNPRSCRPPHSPPPTTIWSRSHGSAQPGRVFVTAEA
jgi:hypothetical protein